MVATLVTSSAGKVLGDRVHDLVVDGLRVEAGDVQLGEQAARQRVVRRAGGHPDTPSLAGAGSNASVVAPSDITASKCPAK